VRNGWKLGVKGRQDAHRDEQIPQVVHRFVRGHRLEGGMGDLDLALGHRKKELVGPYKNGGKEWHPAGDPEQVHDFIDPTLGKANPYGVYDLGADTGWVSVGTDHDTAAFAVATIRRWWQSAANSYPNASRLLITADGGGSNGSRTRLWKTELAAFAADTGLTITVCHLPPGTSKWCGFRGFWPPGFTANGHPVYG